MSDSPKGKSGERERGRGREQGEEGKSGERGRER